MSSKFDPIKEQVLAIAKKYGAQNPSNWMDFFKFTYDVTGELIELVEYSSSIVKENKKETVIEALQYAYNEIDPDLPWIPEPIESQIENFVLDNAVPVLIDWIVDTFNSRGVFDHDSDSTVD